MFSRDRTGPVMEVIYIREERHAHREVFFLREKPGDGVTPRSPRSAPRKLGFKKR
jgi:hypothetical protein